MRKKTPMLIFLSVVDNYYVPGKRPSFIITRKIIIILPNKKEKYRTKYTRTKSIFKAENLQLPTILLL